MNIETVVAVVAIALISGSAGFVVGVLVSRRRIRIRIQRGR